MSNPNSDVYKALVERMGSKLAADGESGREALEELGKTGDCASMDVQFVEIFHMWACVLGVPLQDLCQSLIKRAEAED